jgi:hypothetical protein
MKLLYQGTDVSNFYPVNGFNRARQCSLPLDVGFSQQLSSKRFLPDDLFRRAELSRRWRFCSHFSVIRASPTITPDEGATSASDSTWTFLTLRAPPTKTQNNAIIMNTHHTNQTLLTDHQNKYLRRDHSIRSEFISVPVGSFAGTLERVIRIRDGRPVPADTGDQGGGQN